MLTTVMLRWTILSTVVVLGSRADADDAQCPGQMFSCSDHRCIPLSWMCDGDKDCIDGEDEHDDQCGKKAVCELDEFECKGGDIGHHLHDEANPLLAASRNARPKCIPARWQCDGEFDCADRSDEQNCTDITCSPTQHQCGSTSGAPGIKLCIPISWKCDQHSDCADGSDEMGCPTNDTKTIGGHQCTSEEFRCANGVCIFEAWKCDGDNDCGDRSDEEAFAGCTKTTCGPEEFRCAENGFCIPNKWRCDGESDCIDHSDENCTDTPGSVPLLGDHEARLHPVTCNNKTEFACVQGDHCVMKSWLCDGDPDCPDRSDEWPQNCPDPEEKRKQCDLAHQFLCDNIRCLNITAKCNDVIECTDGSDERDCPTHAPCVGERNFDCGNAYCIKSDQVCDGNPDCPSGVDETDQLCSKNSGNCDVGKENCECRRTPKGGNVCYCKAGFKPKDSDKSCEDVNECSVPGTCDQLCNNTVGGYICRCHKMYILEKDGKHCRAMGNEHPKLLLANRATIRQVDLITKDYQPLITHLDAAVAMDFLHKNNTVIWSDVAQETIMMCRMKPNTTRLNNVTECENKDNLTLVADKISTPDGLAVDWVHDLLYWTDTGLNLISVMHIWKGTRKTLFDKDLDEPRAIAVDPLAGLIFWTDWGENARIERAGMDGDGRKVIVEGNDIKWPNGLALDTLDKRVYWADAKMKMISSVDYYGGDKRKVVQSWANLRHPFSLSLFEEKLYWTDWDREGVLSTNKFTGGDINTVVSGINGPMTVRVYHQQAQPEIANKCLGHRCSDLCLPKSHIDPKKDDKLPAAEQLAMQLILPIIPYTCACVDGSQPKSESESHICVDSTGPATTSISTTTIPLTLIDVDKFSTTTITTDSPQSAAAAAQLTAFVSSGHPKAKPGSTGRSYIVQPSPGGLSAKSVFMGIFLMAAILLVGFIYYRRQVHRPLRPLNFENPVYRNTVEDADQEFGDGNIFANGNAGATNGGRLRLSLDSENYNPSRPSAGTDRDQPYTTDSQTQPLTEAMVC